MPFFLELHHAIGKPPASPLTDYKWERLPLGDGHDVGFPSLTDPALIEVRDRLLTHPAIAGVRVVFQAAKPQPAPAGPPPTDGQVVMVSGR